MYDVRNLVNIADYPIHIDGGKRDAVLKSVRESLALDGCAVLKNFLTADGIAALTKEADAVARIRTFIFFSYLITNCFIISGVIRHWNNVPTERLPIQYQSIQEKHSG